MATKNQVPIAELSNVHLTYKVKLLKMQSWRDQFVNLMNFSVPSQETNSVLKGISFKIFKGDRLGLLGVNGAGKTSICKLLADFFGPSQGSVNTFGHKTRAVLDSGAGVLPELTGRENAYLLFDLIFPLDPNRNRLITEALSFSELDAFLDAPFKTYSTGMQTRLLLAVLSCQPTDLLILDEVFEGADQFFREKIAQRILKMIENSGAVVFVSHDPQQIKRVCNRLLILESGKVVYDGDVDSGILRYSMGSTHSNSQHGLEL